MESCRPGSDDLLDPRVSAAGRGHDVGPRLAERFARQQRADAAVAAACRDVPVPDGLARACWSGWRRRVSPRGTVPFSRVRRENWDSPRERLTCRPTRRRGRSAVSRRWLAVAAAALGTAAALLAAVWVESHRAAAYTPLAVLEQATEFFRNETPAAGVRPGDVRRRPPTRSVATCCGRRRFAGGPSGGCWAAREWRTTFPRQGAAGRRCTWFPRLCPGCPRNRPGSRGRARGAVWRRPGRTAACSTSWWWTGDRRTIGAILRPPSGPADLKERNRQGLPGFPGFRSPPLRLAYSA